MEKEEINKCLNNEIGKQKITNKIQKW